MLLLAMSIVFMCCGCNFTMLPIEVVSHKVWGCLSIADKKLSIACLNKAGRRHFLLYHQDEIELYKQLLSEIRKLDRFSVNAIENITEKLQFSELLSLMLPATLKAVSKHFQYEMELILEAMNLHTMSMSEFRQLQIIRNSTNSELDILILASRALVCLSVFQCCRSSEIYSYKVALLCPIKHRRFGEIRLFRQLEA